MHSDTVSDDLLPLTRQKFELPVVWQPSDCFHELHETHPENEEPCMAVRLVARHGC